VYDIATSAGHRLRSTLNLLCEMSEPSLPQSEFILYQPEDGRMRVQCRFENENIWLSQALLAELFQKDVRGG
jgi:hypothetical protein